jgi:hypothetical protein
MRGNERWVAVAATIAAVCLGFAAVVDAYGPAAWIAGVFGAVAVNAISLDRIRSRQQRRRPGYVHPHESNDWRWPER